MGGGNGIAVGFYQKVKCGKAVEQVNSLGVVEGFTKKEPPSLFEVR